MVLEELKQWIGEAYGEWTGVMDQSRVDGSVGNYGPRIGDRSGKIFLTMDRRRVDGSVTVWKNWSDGSK